MRGENESKQSDEIQAKFLCALSIFGISKIPTQCLKEALVTWPLSASGLFYSEALPEGGPMSPVWIFKRLVSVFINACRLLSALPSLLQFGWGRLSLVAPFSFYALSLLFGPCRLSEFTLAGPLFYKSSSFPPPCPDYPRCNYERELLYWREWCSATSSRLRRYIKLLHELFFLHFANFCKLIEVRQTNIIFDPWSRQLCCSAFKFLLRLASCWYFTLF